MVILPLCVAPQYIAQPNGRAGPVSLICVDLCTDCQRPVFHSDENTIPWAGELRSEERGGDAKGKPQANAD